jgi:hypothetical protein
MSAFDEDYPMILSIQLDRPHPTYISRWVTQPQFVVNTSLQPGDTYQMDRYGFFGDNGDLTEDARERQPDSLVGNDGERQIPKTKVLLRIKEFTGPSAGDPTNPRRPGNLKLSRFRIQHALRQLYDIYGFDTIQQPEFHESIGSIALLDDYRRTVDRFYLNLLNSCPNKYNPQGVLDGGTYSNGPPVFTVKDLNVVYEGLRRRNVPLFPDGYYHLLCDDRMLRHLREDPAFQQIASSSAYYSVPMVMASDPRLFGPGRMPPAMGGINYMAQPNQLMFQGLGLNQAAYGSEMGMPAGIIFAGFRIFSTTNLFTTPVSLTYTSVPTQQQTNHPQGSALRNGYLGFAFGKNVVGECFGGDPESGIPVRVKKNLNDDYQRFLILIWQAFFGLALLNPDFCTVCRTFGD